ncbi:MerR HTH family regulatory protein [compost metagenome]
MPQSASMPSRDDDYQQALAGGLLPIREVARRTGVNPVTLRAWERRYGLIVPQRTAKGHRLYSRAHIEQIQEILAWLGRGVAVSKIRDLLENSEAQAPDSTSPWHPLLLQSLGAIGQTDERRLDELFNAALAIYPVRTLCEHFMQPLLVELERRWQGQFGNQLERVFFLSWLRSKLGARLYHHNRQTPGAPLLLVNQSDLALEPGLWLSAWLASSSGCPIVVFDWPLPPGELALAVQRLRPRGVLLYSSRALNLNQLPRLLAGIDCPRLIGGAATSIHDQELSELADNTPGLHLARDPLGALLVLQQLRLLQA